ncbi:MAG: DMT family transporter [Burkholderiaceae bacterium]|jgi:drug/metabolite transporter (DMT)-like permease|nr:DMT family transporter [Burkholderiaceae bacterium]MCU0966288.1 DMT family transporter [Burkholderiaceae bacterium]
MSLPTQAISSRAFIMLLLLACMFGGNHVAARFALDNGVDVASAVAVRSLLTAVVVALIVALNRVPLQLDARQRKVMPLIGLLVAVQSLCLYSAVARIPVGLALLAFNTYPLWTALAARLLYGHRPERAVLVAMPLILFGLALALDVSGTASGLGLQAHWARMGSGVGFALAAGATFGLVLALTQHEVAALDGRLRTAITMAIVGVLALLGSFTQGGLHWPNAVAGWWGLALLTLLYGTAFTIMFTLLPKLGVVGSSPILNVEPVAALAMAWLWLGQTISPVQVAGALLVVGTVMALGLRRR